MQSAIGVIGNAWDELRVTARVILAVVIRPARCPRCHQNCLDVLPGTGLGSAVLAAIGFLVVRCHDCQQELVTW